MAVVCQPSRYTLSHLQRSGLILRIFILSGVILREYHCGRTHWKVPRC